MVLSDLTIEHVMPRAIGHGKAGKAWQEMLGENWRELHDKWLHTLGNLTLSGYNEPMGNKPYDEKRVVLSKSKLGLNTYFPRVETWNECSIEQRGGKLAAKVADLWPRPAGSAYVPPTEEAAESLSPEERIELVMEFWSGLLDDLSERKVFPKLPEPSEHTSMRFVIGHSGFNLMALLDLEKGQIGVALRCGGPHAKKYFELFYGDRDAIEKELGEDLIWQQRPSINRTHIILWLRGVYPKSRSEWPDQWAWFASKLKAFFQVFNERITSLRPGIGAST